MAALSGDDAARPVRDQASNLDAPGPDAPDPGAPVPDVPGRARTDLGAARGEVLADRPLGSRLVAALRLAAYLLVTLAAMPFQALLLGLGLPGKEALPRAYHALTLWLMGFEIIAIGRPVTARPALLVANHSSYIDIPAISSVVKTVFVAKADVRAYPLFGTLARLQDTVFVDRRPTSIGVQRDALAERLARGQRVVLFAEGTSSDGTRVLPFKSALFAAALDHARAAPGGLVVQPVTVAVTALDGMPIGRSLRPRYAWFGDMDLAPHLWGLVQLGRVTITVIFHAPFAAESLPDRRRLAAACHAAVAAGLGSCHAGRPAAVDPSGPAGQ